ncbi:hypothetical protein [Polyangium sp. y55x31]|uniref:hypothetical protein n=1 Tax=Polyangium sp. y55x31 TaxID=3042688 RepID=UPI002482E15B|nr:hypothetical protein [Polyangium sp. y55x31]MDI1480272.1 hypothetical protein [Polyangium sp. y55x31]
MANSHGPTRAARALPSFALITLFACSGPPLPPPPTPAASPAPTEAAKSPAEPPKLSLLQMDEPPVQTLAAGPVATFAGRFEPVPLPPQMPTIVSVDARSERDVWMVAADGHVLRWDGARVVDRGTPQCFTDSCCGTLVDCAKQPAMCAKKAVEDCQPFGPSCALPVSWSSIRIDGDDVIVRALVETGGMRASVVESRLGKKGRWACEQGAEDYVYPGSAGRGDGAHAVELSVDGASLHLEGSAVLVNAYGGNLLLLDGRRVPLPNDLAYGPDAQIAARAPDDLWLWVSGESAWRGNGLSWTPLSLGLEAVNDIWFDAKEAAWILGAEVEGKEQLVRWDVGKGGGQRFETPGATYRKGDGKDFWLLGEKALYRWDGATLRRAAPPLLIAHAWRSPSGELWLVGSDPAAKTTQGDEEIRMGAVFRVPGGKP